MIDRVGQSGPGRIGVDRADKGAPVTAINPQGAPHQGQVESAVFEMAGQSAPVDGAKVDAIRAAIAEGRYPVDADRIAGRMLADDLPLGR